MTKSSEQAYLVERARGCDTEAFGTLVRRYQNAAYATALEHLPRADDCEDVVQEAFVSAWCKLDLIFDARTIPESYVFLLDVQRVPYGVQYEDDGAIADFVSAASPVAMLENDGVLVTGSSVLDAFDRLEVLESTSALINASALGPVAPMSDEVIDELRALCNLPPL